MFEKLKAWCLKQWKAIAAFAGLAIAAAVMYLRSKDQKEILDYTSKSLKEEADVNKDAENKLVDGLRDISKKKDQKLNKAEKDHAKRKKDLDDRKKDFVDKSGKDENLESLAKDLADKIGADFVE